MADGSTQPFSLRAAQLARSLSLLAVAVAAGSSGCSSAEPQSVNGTAGGSPDTGTGATSGGAAGTNAAAGSSAGAAGTSAGAAGSSTGAAGSSAGSAGAAGDSSAGGGAGESGSGGSMPVAGEDGGDSPNQTGPGDWGPGDYPPDLNAPEFLQISNVTGQSGAREYKVHVPPSYQPEVAMPLVFCIHGLGQDALLFCVSGAGMHTKSDAAGFILVMPNGYQNSWNAGTCCGGASTEQVDDVALFRAIFAEVGTHLNIDLDRVYATGLSNGAYMSYRLACEAADIFAAVAPGAGAIGINDIGGGTNPQSNFTACEPSQPISILDIHGMADGLVPYSLQAPTLALAAANNGCATTTHPATAPSSAGDTSCITHDGCPDGIELTACSIEGGGHCWFGSSDCGTGAGEIGMAFVGANSDTMHNTDAIWDFFARHSR